MAVNRRSKQYLHAFREGQLAAAAKKPRMRGWNVFRTDENNHGFREGHLSQTFNP